jgi:hypothetical protein
MGLQTDSGHTQHGRCPGRMWHWATRIGQRRPAVTTRSKTEMPLPHNVRILGCASFLNDVAREMIFPLTVATAFHGRFEGIDTLQSLHLCGDVRDD